MRTPFCSYLKLLNATHIRKVACVAGGTVMLRVLSWRRRPRGIWLVPNIYAAQPLKKVQLSPANSASYAGYRKATRKGKKSKQRFEVKPGNLSRNLPSLLLDRKKQRNISSSLRTSKDERNEEGPSYSLLGRNLRLCPLPTFVLPRKKTVPVEPLRPLRHLYSMENSIQETQNLPSWTNVHKIFLFGTSIHWTFALVPKVSPE